MVEHHAEVDCGTVVENSTILPFTYVGAGLDVMHSVVGFRRVAHLVRNVEVEIHDDKLVGMIPFSAVSRLAGSTAALFAFLPKEIYRGLFAPSRRKQAARNAEPPEEAGVLPGESGVGSFGFRLGTLRVPLQFGSREEIWRPLVGPLL